jgi:7-carboxy-7-deazaguanine synthase
MMHGQNRRRKQEHRADGALQVREIFRTIQGEGPFAGQPATFVRLTGCNLKCHFCDTIWDDDQDLIHTVEQVVQATVSLTPAHVDLVVLTGGEPLRQNIEPFIRLLYERRPDIRVQIETAGTLWQEALLQEHVYTVVSPKTPRIDHLVGDMAYAFKYVVIAGELEDDGLPGMSTQAPGKRATLARPRAGVPVYLSPCDEGDPVKNQRNMRAVAESAMKHGYTAGLQLHKIFGLS